MEMARRFPSLADRLKTATQTAKHAKNPPIHFGFLQAARIWMFGGLDFWTFPNAAFPDVKEQNHQWGISHIKMGDAIFFRVSFFPPPHSALRTAEKDSNRKKAPEKSLQICATGKISEEECPCGLW